MSPGQGTACGEPHHGQHPPQPGWITAPHSAAELGAYIFPPNRLVHADMAIVFGMNDCDRPALAAIAAYQAGHARRLVFTGGYNAAIGATEAQRMAAVALRHGVPQHDIILEPRARHTGQNAEFARQAIAACTSAQPPSSLLIVTIHFHLRRSLLAVEKWFPDVTDIGWRTYPSRFYTAENWFSHPRGQSDVRSEMIKIRAYYGEAALPAGQEAS